MSEGKAQRSVSDILKEMYTALDSTTKKALEKASIVPSCKKGCDACCHLLCTCTFAEGVLMAETLLTGGDWELWLPKLRTSALATDYPNVENDNYFAKKIPCVFLKDSACSIYDIRPAACRFHMVVSPPENCSPDNFQQTTVVDLQPLEKQVWGLSKDVINEVFGGNLDMLAGPLALMVLACARVATKGEPSHQAIVEACSGLLTPGQWMKRIIENRVKREQGQP